jgi:raffinose/stachyose/melibiose transport system permease protein
VNGATLAPPGEPRRVGYLYLLPALVVFALFVLVPLGHSAWLSLFEWDGVTPGTWVGLDNYEAVASDGDLRAAFLHAFVLVAFYAVLPIVIGLVLAAAMARTRVRGLALFRTILFLPQVIALVVVAVMWRMIYAPETGLINETLRAVGLGSLAQNWLGSFSLALPSVGLIGTWVMFGLAMVLFAAGVQKIPPSLYDAARMDGAGPVPVYEVYDRAFRGGDVGTASAIGVCVAVAIFLLTFLINRVAEREAAR